MSDFVMTNLHIDADQVMQHAVKLSYRMSKAYNKISTTGSNPTNQDRHKIFTDALSRVTSFLSDDNISAGLDTRIAILEEHISNFEENIQQYLQQQINKDPQQYFLLFLNNFDALIGHGGFKIKIHQDYQRLNAARSSQFSVLANYMLFSDQPFGHGETLNRAFALDTEQRSMIYTGMSGVREQYVQMIAPHANAQLMEEVRLSMVCMQQLINGQHNVVAIETASEEPMVEGNSPALGRNAQAAISQYREQPQPSTQRRVVDGP